MQIKTSQKTMQSTTHTTKATEPKFGSDEYMLQRGYHPATKEEREKYGKFVNREGAFSILSGLIKTQVRRLFVKREEPQIFVVQIEGATAGVGRQESGRLYTRQIEGASTSVFQEQSEHWQKVPEDELEPALGC